MGSNLQALISVIMPCFNADKYIAAAINSVLQQGYNNLQIIIVDDGSTDQSREVIQSFGSQVEYHYQSNAGISAARNTALGKVKGDYIAFLDSDDLWSSQSLVKRYSFLQSDLESDFVFGEVKAFLSEDDKENIGQQHHLPETNAGRLAGSILIRAESFFKVGLFDEGLRVGETVDWLLRAQEQGIRGSSIDQLILLRRVHSSNTVTQESELNKQYFQALRASLKRRKQGQG